MKAAATDTESITVAGREYRSTPDQELRARGYSQISERIRVEEAASAAALLGMFAAREAAGVPWAISLCRQSSRLICVVWVQRPRLVSPGQRARLKRKQSMGKGPMR